MSDQRYKGSCHCQAVKYEAEFDIAAGSSRCNCSLCAKSRAWFLFVNVPTVDDLDREELVHAPLRFQDRAHDRIDRVPADTRLM